MPESVQSLLGETPGGANRAMLKDATHYVAEGKNLDSHDYGTFYIPMASESLKAES